MIAQLLPCLELGLIYGLMSLGVFLTFRVMDWPDLTCDGSFVTGAAVYVLCLSFHVSPMISLFCAFGAGGGMGLITGALALYAHIPKLLAGILVAFMAYSLNLRIMGAPNMMIEDHWVGQWPALFLITGGTALCVTWVLSTQWGLGLRALGRNERLCHIYRVPVLRTSLAGLILSNGVIGLSGALLSQHQGFVDATQGTGSLVMGLASIMIGERFFPSIRAAALACFVGAILYRGFIALALAIPGFETQDMNLVIGGLVIATLWIAHRKSL